MCVSDSLSLILSRSGSLYRHGLADDEREALWKDGIETVAWLEQLRVEDFLVAGIDVTARMEQAEAEDRAQRAWESKERAEQRADPVSWRPIDNDQYFSKSGRQLDARRMALKQRDDEMLKARQRGDERALEARRRCDLSENNGDCKPVQCTHRVFLFVVAGAKSAMPRNEK